MNWYLEVVRKYATFSGRARRKEYWMFLLFNIIISVVLSVLDAMLGTMFIGIVYSLAMLIPSIAVSVRRLHDINRSGWWCLIALVPFVGAIVLLVFAVMEGNAGQNEYGADPKAEAA
ncbi:DUF805 domain-containing protein [Aquabacterium sp. A7-Y]|uniref:DUF805 domain-containing protein n=1 Tax=Aquabacterium sp. A7-Y TaxID=1349605 RepID=UPI00223CEE5B|nr:DUF805 domain-containing protein [Aquabacterium sp. A7-Y]MCW7541731.1 DUF805 domain-containing protein [Aquabacterium sp. A7-Y]